MTTAKSYGYSISLEDGVDLTTAAELTRRAVGADGNAGSVTLDVRAYHVAFVRHAVLAARLGAATAWGDGRVRRVFSVAGSGPQLSGFRFGSDAVALVRGFREDAVLGPHAVVANLDYRVPLARVQRGVGTIPVFLRTIHGSVFADAGQAWTGAFRSHDLRASAGAELSFDTVLGYGFPITIAGGAAWRHDPSGREKGLTVFGRVGRAF
jgi:outer membrane protein assembly factor BamA